MPVERGTNAIDDLLVGQVLAFVGDAKSGEPETGCRNAGHPTRIAAAAQIVACAIENLAGFVAGLLPEEETCLAFQIVEEGFIAAPGLPLRCDQVGRQKRTTANSSKRFDHLAAGHNG